MKVSLSKSRTYAPKCLGNRKLKGDNQITVEYMLMTAEEEEKYSDLYLRREGDDDFGMTVKTHAIEIWDAKVTKVNGIWDTEGNAITDPEKVRNIPGIYELVSEVAAIIKRGLTEADSKN